MPTTKISTDTHIVRYHEYQEYQNQPSESDFGFRYREIESQLSPEEQFEQVNTLTHNAIFFQLEGELRLRWAGHEEIVVKAGDIYFLPRGANVSGCIVGDHIRYIVARLEHNLDNYKSIRVLNKYMHEQRQQNKREEHKFTTIRTNASMMRLLESIEDYVKRGVDNQQLFDMKLMEMQCVFSWCYTIEESAKLFSHIDSFNSDFEWLVLDNYSTSTTIDELANLAHVSRSTFNRKFKEVFNTTPLKWIDKQTRHKILRKAGEPNVKVKDLMYEVEVYNPSQFTQLCKRLCGVIPSQLIKRK